MEEVPLEELVGNDAQDGAPQAAEAEVVLPLFAEAIGADADNASTERMDESGGELSIE